MLFEKKYNYYLVKFDDERTYWYRSLSAFHRLGTKVIVPISNNGKWKIGTIAGKQKFVLKDVPYPLIKTKGIIQEAGLLSENKVALHNTEIDGSKYPPIDISIASIKTRKGMIEYLTCQRERELLRETLKKRNKKIVIIENYPVSDFSEIPLEAQERLKAEENRRMDDWLEEMIIMDELDSND